MSPEHGVAGVGLGRGTSRPCRGEVPDALQALPREDAPLAHGPPPKAQVDLPEMRQGSDAERREAAEFAQGPLAR